MTHKRFFSWTNYLLIFLILKEKGSTNKLYESITKLHTAIYFTDKSFNTELKKLEFLNIIEWISTSIEIWLVVLSSCQVLTMLK